MDLSKTRNYCIRKDHVGKLVAVESVGVDLYISLRVSAMTAKSLLLCIKLSSILILSLGKK